MIHNISIETNEDGKIWFIFEDRPYPIDYCCQCQQFILPCAKEDPCQGTSCNGGGCPDCIAAYGEFWNVLAGPLTNLLKEAYIQRRRQEKLDYAEGVKYISFFDHLGVDWENGERPKGWS